MRQKIGAFSIENRKLVPLERMLYRLAGVDPAQETGWQRYAVAMVLFTHASFLFVPVVHDLSVFDPWWLPGQLGVELFFVLSGFLIGGILATEAERGDLDVRQFWIRRWLRTLPNYYLFLVLNLVLERYATGAWPHAWSYVLFWQNRSIRNRGALRSRRFSISSRRC